MRALPAVAAAGCTAAYGGLKLYWALGGTAGLRQAPLPRPAIQKALDHDPAAVAGHWASVALALAGIAVALATLHPALDHGRSRWAGRLLRRPLFGLAGLMVLRAVLQAIGDVQRLAHGVSPAAAYTATWDLALWSPFFLVWGVCWALAARRLTPRA